MQSKSRWWMGPLSLAALAAAGADETAAQALDTDFLLTPKPARIELAFPDIATTSSYRVRLSGSNAEADDVEADPPIVGPILSGGAEALTQAATPTAPSVTNNGCSKIKSKQQCMFDIRLPPGLAPGSYSCDVLVTGKNGGQSVKTVSLDIRASAWWAGVVIALGVALGAAVTDWRGTARPIVNKRIEAARLREEALHLAASTGQVSMARRVRQLALDLKVLDSDILAGKDDPAKLPEYRERLDLLNRADALLQAAAEPKNGAAGVFSLLAQRLEAALVAVEWKKETVTAAADTLSAELTGFQPLFAAAQRFDKHAGELKQAVEYLGAAGETTQWKAALALRKEAFQPLQTDGDGTQTTTRAKPLNEAADILEAMPATIAPIIIAQLDGDIATQLVAASTDDEKKSLQGLQTQVAALKSRVPDAAAVAEAGRLGKELASLSGLEGLDGTVEVPAIVEAGSGLKFEWSDTAFQPEAGATLADLTDSRKAWDLMTNAIALAGIASVGVMVLWATNTTWGSVQDIILASLAGAGTRLSIGKIGQTAQQ
ncbi:hypothetical protein O7A70_28625 [Mesorhizobium sp. Cs1299R1N1]|uniref:hypothetical protein n=1 Tax=Mesorhizobium sp. Cs1299R1N1 TaxID=3015172 RepID=UPI00301D1711